MTVKTQGGKVITKGGKVSCECCGDEPDYCMYSAQQFVDEFYTEDDLPDAVTIGGISYSRSGTSYGDTTNGIILEGNVWAKYTNGTRTTQGRLIEGNVFDQFSDCYNVTIPDFWFNDSAGPRVLTVNRVSRCFWFIVTIGYDGYLEFNEDSIWLFASAFENGDPLFTELKHFQDQNQNTPEGLYGNPIRPQATVAAC
jgi:hypothetical protein